MGRTIMGAVVSLDGDIAYDDDTVGPLFDCYGKGQVAGMIPPPGRDDTTVAAALGDER